MGKTVRAGAAGSCFKIKAGTETVNERGAFGRSCKVAWRRI